MQLVLTTFFILDMVVNFNVEVYVYKRKQYSKKRRDIALAYLFGRPVPFFWIDLLAVFPFDAVVGAAMDACDSEEKYIKLLRLIMLLRLLRIVRLCPLRKQLRGVC
jgi:O-antigen/teichoic acid export membrane protein